MQTTGAGDGLENEKKKNRSKRAECPTCGTKLTGKKKQTTNGRAASGRCLACHPVDEEEKEDRSNIPKVLIVEIRSEDDENSAISEITLDRRLLSIDEENGVYGSRMAEDASRHAGSTNLSYSKSSRAFKSNAVDDQDNESVLTESENDEDGANHMRRSHRSARSMNNSSHHNAVSLSSSARNRWGESEAGMDADSTGPRPQPPRRVPSTDRERNQSVHQSLPSRLTITTVNTTCQSSPPNRSSSPKQGSGSPNQRQGSSQKISTRVPRVAVPNSPAKKSHFIPPWNPKNPNNDNNIARKPNEERQNEGDDSHKVKDERIEFVVVVSNTIHDNIHVRNDMVPTIGITRKISRKSGSKNFKEYSDNNESDKARGSAYEISLLGSNHLETKQIADIDQSDATGLLQKNGAHEKSDSSHYIESRSRMTRKPQDEIHVDLASSYATRKISSPMKNVTPRTKRRQQALHMLVQMEQIFPSEDRSLSSAKPPKKALRSGSEEIDWALVPAEFPLLGRDILACDGTSSNTKSGDFANKIMAMDVRQMLSSIANEESRESRIEIIRVLTFMTWTKDTITHRKQFAEANGMEVLRTLLLTEIHLNVQTAVLKLVLVLITGACELDGMTPTLSAADNVDIIVDVILAAMETYINVEEIQLLGCQVLCCLSSELSASRDVVDGSNAGACFSVLSAMEAHGESVTMQEWGIRCLYNQCVYSMHAKSNKRTVLLAKLSQGKGQSVVGRDVLLRVLKSCNGRQTNLFLIEWICKLYMALCSSKEIAELFSPATDLLRNLLNIIHIQNKEFTAQAELLEAALIIISSLIHIERNKSCINITDTFVIMLDTIACRGEDLEVVALCCSLMSKLVSEQSLRKDALLGIGTARRIMSVIVEYPDELRVRESVSLILACLCRGMEGFKHQICTRETIEQLMMVWQTDMKSSESDASIFQENVCTLIVSLFASESERLRARAVRYGALDLLGKVIERGIGNPRLQDLAVVGLMNLSSGSSIDCLMDDGMNYVEMIIRAMESNRSSSNLQKNGCSALWNIGVKSDIGIGQIIRGNGVSCIVSCLQNHLENQDVVVAACGTLWSLSLHDVALKRIILRTDNAMEIIAKIILLNGGSRAVQEQACGVLASVASSISESNAHEAATCVPTLIEAMRIDSCILPVLQCGAKFLRQVVVYLPEYADPSCDTLTVLIKAMREYRSAHAFQEDACNFLWTLSEKSPTAKERILNMDGISIVMEILDKSCNLQSKENLALGSFKELTLSNS